MTSVASIKHSGECELACIGELTSEWVNAPAIVAALKGKFSASSVQRALSRAAAKQRISMRCCPRTNRIEYRRKGEGE